MSEVQIRSITIEEWEKYKLVRLRSLSESPDAFGSTYERESIFTDEEWIERVSVNTRVSRALPLIAEQNGEPIGLACGVVHAPGDDCAMLYQMWVDPSRRGQGIGRLLLNSVIGWARSMNLKAVELAVTTTNIGAVNLYRSSGFIATSKSEPLRLNSDLHTQQMVLNLSGGMRNSVPLRLYDYRFSGSSYKIRLILSQLEQRVEVVPVDILNGETRTPEFLRMNSMGQIPVLELSDGTFLSESNAILFWLAAGTKLMPENHSLQFQALQWMFFEQSNIDKVLGRTRFLKAFPEFRTPAPHEWEEWYRAGNQGLAVIDAHLSGNKFLVGKNYSIADISLYGYVHTADEGGFKLADFANIKRWLQEIESTDGYVRQMDGNYP